jgi:hypothetical protein
MAGCIMRRALVLAIALGGTAAVSAHVAPSVDDNNRYLKLTPLGDRVRLAYVVFYGEVPGARLRPSIDTNRDGSIGDAEAQAFGAKLGGELAAALEVSVDGAPQRLAWTTISVGMGTARVAAGSFSVDLVTWLCIAGPPGLPGRGRHEVRLVDRFAVPRPGETEVKIEDSPGVRIDRAKIGDLADPSGSFRFAGPGGPLSDRGLELAFTAGDQALVPTDGACGAAASAARRGPPVGAIAGAAGALGCALAGAAILVRRLRRRRRHSARR